MKINVNNGTLGGARKRDGEDYVSFVAHDPADLITKIAPVDYDPDATCPEYEKFITRVQPVIRPLRGIPCCFMKRIS